MRNGVRLAAVLATSAMSASIAVPFPTTQGLWEAQPGLSAGPVTVDVYNQTAAGDQSWGLVGSIPLTVNDSRSSI